MHVANYDELWEWSVTDLDAFWTAIWEFFSIESTTPYESVASSEEMPGVRWFQGARLNYAEHALRHHGDGDAIIARSQTRDEQTLSWAQLRDEVARIRSGLIALGLQQGDVVAAYLPNIPEAVIAMLASASLGCIWMCCPPEFGARAVIERFGQLEPKVLITIDGYVYGSASVDRRDVVREVRDALPTLIATVAIAYLHPDADGQADTTEWDAFGIAGQRLAFTRVAADHPLYVLFSSGTTGPPKAILHSHAGILVEHFKTLGLHGDLKSADRFFWFTTTGWMMWNYLISGLLLGSTIVLFDGNPGYPGLRTLWKMVAELRISSFGTGAPFLAACERAGLELGTELDLSALRIVGSTGSPLSPECYEWVYSAVSKTAMLSSLSGGTDICSAFVGGSPTVPVWSGEISCRYLGADVQAIDPDGQRLIGKQGELVICKPMPSMPLGFVNDPDGVRYRAAYFDRAPGLWHHGDWITITERGSCIITGRSDATLNRGGVRIGTAEIYRSVERVAGVVDTLVVHLEDSDGDGPGSIVLLVVVDEQHEDLQELARQIRRTVRDDLSPRHVPDEIHYVESIPVTLSGKKLEVPVKRILMGARTEDVASSDGVKEPRSLEAVEELATRRTTQAACAMPTKIGY
ncbi:MAG: acetoacetyl-CoA synthetase [Ilumatobacteraceae bacterium]|nr:acetoacetyl-CoA synthetase [Ilumatobacteraceae bacterium]